MKGLKVPSKQGKKARGKLSSKEAIKSGVLSCLTYFNLPNMVYCRLMRL